MMAEENKSIRLNKVAREFNIGISTIVDYLAKKGHKIENNPNTKIDEVMYKLLSREFQSEKNVKETAQKIGLDYAGRTSVTIESIEKEKIEKEKEEEPSVEHEFSELLIKNVISYAPVEKHLEPEEHPKEKIIEEVIIPKVEEVIIEEKAAIIEPEIIEPPVVIVKEEEPIVIIEKIESEPKIVETVEEVHEIKEEKETVIEKIEEILEVENIENVAEEDQENKIKVVGKIDLSKLNQKTKPDKVSKVEKRKFIKEKEKFKEKLKAEAEKNITQEIAQEVIPSEVVEETKIKLELATPVVETEAQELNESATEEPKREDNFIKTKYEKLEGPKILNKIELPVLKKPVLKKQQPVATSSDPIKKHHHQQQDRKRPRLNKEKPTAPKATDKPHTQHPPKTDVKKPLVKEEKKGRFKVIKAIKPEVNDNAIEKQIKETLARLSPTGKSKTSKYRREKRQQVSQQYQEDQIRNEEDKKIIKVTEFVTANELASMMDVPVTSVIATCMNLGMFVSINQRLDAEALNIVADEFGYKVDFVSVEVLEAITDSEENDNPEDIVERAPIVTVMGHVDHGKTSLLDYIRNANVIAGEAGGITQHIGAYEVKLDNGRKITFLDTPGHEAFTAMRARGAKITDVAIIVVACDDKIMPQTIEAINHVQAAGVPVVFAINKIDKQNANPEKIKEELAAMNILVEDWGGKYQSQDISAKKGINVDKLLEKVLLEAELLELKGNPKRKASGTVIESSLDKGRGYVAKLLVQNGTIKVGDVILAGATYGKVKAMYNERNASIKTAGPSAPMLLLGLNGAPQAGDKFNVMEDEREAKDIANKRLQLQREQGIRTQKHITLDEIGRRIAIGYFKQLNIIVKGDVDGSVEALSDSLLKLSTQEVQVNVIHKSVGQITESDILLASASDAVVIGFQVRPSLNARKLAEQEQIDVRLYSIIYNAINELKAAIEGMLAPDIEEKIICNIEIREVFKITKVGTIAGCMVLDGKITRNTRIRVIRDGIVVYTGRLGSLKRFKDDVKEVSSGYECGLNIDNFNDIKVGDIVEGYEEIEVKRKLA